MSSRNLALLTLLLALPWLPGEAAAKVFHSRTEALALAFPDADRVEDETIVLGDEQARRIESLARSPLESRLVRVYTGYRGGELLGYAFIDVHNVRTLPEAFLVVLSPEGEVSDLRLLAFHEPLDYMPAEGWYAQFQRKSLAQPLRVDGDIHGILGASLSTRATAGGVRRALAVYQVVVRSAP
ncbi:MAG: FMN-binding protein [Myxococcales bacterium]|nr:FMN-binding protein [Myxococcales bacterium]